MSSPSASPASLAHNELPANSRSQRRRWIWIVLLWAIVYVPGLFSPPLLDDADSVHAEAAREMLVRHDWTTLYIDGVRYLEKAPLLYWGMAASYEVFGVKDWAARLPLILAELWLLLATYSLGKRTLGERAGFWAAIVLTLSIGPYLFTRILIPDMLIPLWLTLGFDFFLRTLEEQPPSRASCWGLAATAALNVLTKGLIGMVFPAAIIGHLLDPHRKSETPAAHASALQHAGVADHCRAVAHRRCHQESCCRSVARLSVVLFRQRTFPALSGQAHTARLRYRPAAGFLGADAAVAVSLVGISCFRRWPRCRIAGSEWRSGMDKAAARHAALCHLGRGHSVVLQLLHAPGVLRRSRAAGAGAADWRLAATGRRSPANDSSLRRAGRIGSHRVGR